MILQKIKGGLQMDFCPVCGSICKIDYKKRITVCSRCGNVIDGTPPPVMRSQKQIDDKIIVVTDSLKRINSLPVKNCQCPKCGNKKAYVSIVGSRNENDYETERYKCTNCDHSWRENP
jgi:DNA-directed RNA polymerase subunit M